jgi:polygalacturonase
LATCAAIPDNAARAVGKGELVLDVRDYGAVAGVDNPPAAFQAAIDAAATDGGRVLPAGVKVTYQIDSLVKGQTPVELEIPAGG